MKLIEFEELFDKRVSHCRNLALGVKNKEYSRKDDKLWNFKRASQVLDLPAEICLLGMLSKHLVSILDLVDDAVNGAELGKALIDEKFSDTHNYLFLLEALLAERMDGFYFNKEDAEK
jgi:hypothetical protein